uniref:Reverse transcriptase domain-containing protein n=1 Tax=Cannabis sativa TaxID=3483 RepID=A0A803QED6_CANSA
MKIISWNSRGLGNPRAVRHLKLLVKEQSPSVLFIMETKLGPNSISRFRNVLCFNNGLEVPRVGLSGGLMLLLKDDVNMFDCYMSCGNGPTWHFTAFYGAPAVHNRLHTWTLLERLKDVAPLLPWIVIGDFNEILSNRNKSGGALRNEAQMDMFRKVLDLCQLHEQAFDGDQFTWIKGRHTIDTIKERLDWCFANTMWEGIFQPIITHHLDYYRSDHRAIAVHILPLNSTHQQQQQRSRRSRFRFEKLWLQEEEATNLIQQNWHQVTTENVADVFVNNLQRCAESLQQWHQQKFGSFKKNISRAQKKVKDLNNDTDRSPTVIQELKHHENVLDELLAQEETYWQQRSRVDWLQNGDQNTNFFHAYASSRRKHNTIKFLSDDRGIAVHSKQGMTDIITAYFGDLFKATDVDLDALTHTIAAIPTTVTAAMNDSLIQPFTCEEIYNALKTISPDKSPGSDGMSAMFYHNGMGDFRPISLCNVIYKIISKTLAIRFKDILPAVISETQSAFLSNRLITDNILVAFELIHHLKHKTRGGRSYSALKLDMSKAFDRVEWLYIQEVMRKMGFHNKWISLIMACLNSTRFSFMLNGEEVEYVQPTRGLRQGLRHKIGNGYNVLAGFDKWIPGHNDFKAISYTGPPTLPVAHFITEQREWNIPLLNAYFQPIDVDRIVTIPLSFFPSNDRLIWHHTTTGCYTVNSGFHLAKNLAEARETSGSNNHTHWWKMFWSLSLPSKEKPKKIDIVSHHYRHSVQNRPAAQHSCTQVSWSPPAGLGLKMNVDAAVNQEHKILGVGAIIRDGNGNVVAAFSKPVQGCFRSDELEAKALFHSLNWAKQLQLQITHVETDALRVSSAINSTLRNLSSFDDLIMDVCYLLSFFSGVTVSHVKRNANQAAYGLAKYALGLDEDIRWMGEIPNPIFSVVINDYQF